MSTTIESLQLEIKSNSVSAESGITALAQSLEKLKTVTKGGLGLTSVAKQITSVGNAVKSIDSSTLSNLTGLASAIKSLSGMKISTTIGKNITAMSEAINKMDMNGFTQKITQMTSSLKPLATQMQKISNGFSVFSKGANKVASSSSALTKHNTKSGSSFLALGGKIGLTVVAIRKIGNAIYNFIKKSSDYIENVNLFTVAMGEYASEAKSYANTVGEIMGIDPGEWMRNQGVFQTLATGFGVASDKASVMSKNLTQLGYDISSFYNIDISESMEKLQSGLAGELEPLRRIGYDLSQAKLEATALELGIDKSVSSMTQAEKALLRYHAIMTQVTTVQGDMARTLDQPANQLRVLKSQVEMLGREIGNVFLPLLQAILPYAIAVTKVLRELVSTIASWVGYEAPEIDSIGVDSLASGSEDAASALDDASKSAKKLKSYMLGFDELNVISPNEDSSSGGLDNGAGAFDFELPEYDFLGGATNERIEGIAESMRSAFEPIGELIEKTSEWAKQINLKPIEKAFSKLGSSLKKTLKVVGNVFDFIYYDVLLPITEWAVENAFPSALDGVANAIDMVTEAVNPVVEGIRELKPVLEPIISWVGDVVITVFNALANGFKEVGQVFTEKGGEIKEIIRGIGEIVSNVWVLIQPIIDEIIPLLNKLFEISIQNTKTFIENIIGIIGGIVDFVAGIFTGDWERVWDGLKGIVVGVWNIIVDSFRSAWETIKAIATALWNALVGIFTPVANWFNEKVIQPVANFFKGLWEAVSGFFVNLWNDIVGIWKAVANWFNEKVIQPVVNFFAPIVETISKFFEGCWLIIQAVWVVVSTWFDEKVIQPVVGFFKALWESVSGFFVSLWDDIVKIWNVVATWFDTYVIQPVVGFFQGVWTSVSGFFSSLWKDIKLVWEKVANWFDKTIIEPVKTAFDKACEAIGKFFSNLWLGIRQGVAKAMNGVIGGIESAINWVIGGINKLVGGFNKIVQWAASVLGQDWGGINLVQEVSFKRITVPTYAEGGFPESGQAFIARENGIPEMVGTIGRRTAVANNEQIVQSVASGVAEANGEQNALLREQNSLLRALLEKDSGVYLDGRSLSDSVDKYKREHGRVLITGGAL